MNTLDGTQSSQELPSNGLLGSTELTSTQAPDSQESSQPQQSIPPDVALLQAQIESERTARQIAEQRHKDTQAAYTRSQQTIQALTNQAPKADPLQPYVEELVQQGYDKRDAEALASTVAKMMQPVLAHQHRLEAVAQSSFMVDSVMNHAVSASPTLFQNPTVAYAVQNALKEDASQGRQITPEYALGIAKIEWANQMLAQQNGQTPNVTVPQVPAMPQQIRSFNGIPNNFSASRPQTANAPVSRSAEQTAVFNQLQSRLKK